MENEVETRNFITKGPSNCFSSSSPMDDMTTMVAECVVHTEEESLSNDSKDRDEELIYERKSSLSEIDTDRRRELLEITRECKEAMIRRLRSMVRFRFNFDLTDEVVTELLTEQNITRSLDWMPESMVTNRDGENLSIVVENCYTLLNLGKEQKSSLIKFAEEIENVTIEQIRQHLKELTEVEATDLAIRQFCDQNRIYLALDSNGGDREEEEHATEDDESCSSSRKEEFSSEKRVGLSNGTRRTAIKLVCDRNMSHASVGKLLDIPKGTVSSMVRCFKSTSRIKKSRRGGCPPKLNESQQLAIVKYVRENEVTTVKRIIQFVKDTYDINVTRLTVQRVLKSQNLVLQKTPVAFVKYLNNDFSEELDSETLQDSSVPAYRNCENNEAANGVEIEKSKDTLVGENRKKRYLNLSNYIRHKIVEFVVKWGMSHSKVANLLGIPKGTVSGVVRCFQRNNRINKIKQGGSYSKLTAEHKAALVKYVSENRDVSVTQAVEYVKQISGKAVSKQTVYSLLKPHNLHKRRKLPSWPKWYVTSKEHVVDIPLKLTSKRNRRTTSVAPISSSRDVGVRSSKDVTDTSVGADGSTDPNLIDVDSDKVSFSYLEDHENLLLQNMQGLFGSMSEGPQTTKVVTSTGEDALDSSSVIMSTTEPLSHVEVSSMADDNSYSDYTIKERDNSVETEAETKKEKKKKKYSSLSNVDRQRIISCVVHKGLSHADVAKLFDVPRGTVSSVIRCFQKTSRIEKSHKGGSQPKMTMEQQESLVRYNEENGPQSIKQLQDFCQNTFGIDVSKSTISVTLKRHKSPLKRKK